jgi:polysaccharide export outer membrane protein
MRNAINCSASSTCTRLFAVMLAFASYACMGQQPEATHAKQSSTERVNSHVQPNRNDLVIGPGDLLQISVYGAPDFDKQVRVSSDGQISLPLIGSLKVEGLTVPQAEQAISERLARDQFFTEPLTSVFVKEYSTQSISVLGEVQKPGIYSLLGSRRLFDAISAAGGTTPKAANSIYIRHRSTPNDAQELTYDPKNTSANVQLLPGDTVVVARAGIVYVVGDVRLPSGIVLDKPNLTVLQAIAVAQGVNPTASLNAVRLIRSSAGVQTDQDIPLQKILQGKAPDVQLQADDVIFVPINTGKSAVRRSMELILQTASGIAIYHR